MGAQRVALCEQQASELASHWKGRKVPEWEQQGERKVASGTDTGKSFEIFLNLSGLSLTK